MMTKKWIAIALAFVISLMISFVFGMRVGGETHFNEDAVYRALLKTGPLSQLRIGEVDKAARMLESMLDDDLYIYATESGGITSYAFLDMIDRERIDSYLTTISAYREIYPYTGLANYDGSELAEEDKVIVREEQEVIANFLERYRENNEGITGCGGIKR